MSEAGGACSADDARLVFFEHPCLPAGASEVGGELKKEGARPSEDPLLEDRVLDDIGLRALQSCKDSCLIFNCRPTNPKPNLV